MSCLVFGSAAVKAAADDSRYRVEILVLTYLEHDQLPDESAALEDFSDALDFLTPPPVDETAASAEANGEGTSATAAGVDTSGREGLAAADDPGEPLCAVVHVPDMGPEMKEAWRRLRLSGPFRPLQYLAWEQPGTPPFPALRVHDPEVVFTEDPWLQLRGASEEEQQAAPVFGDTVTAAAGGNGVETAGGGEGPLPSPIQYYRLDGRAQLVRTRFLHLDIKLELREPQFDPAQELAPAPAGTLAGPEPTAPQPTSFLVQRLEQRRQVKTGRMEYFDGPVIGVLAYITDVSELAVGESPDQ